MSTVNLLPEDYLRRRSQDRANTICLIVFALVMGGVLIAGFISERRLYRAGMVLQRVNDEYAKASKLIEQMQQLEARKHRMYEKAELTGALLERVPRSTLLAIVTNARPQNVSITEFKLTTKQHTIVRKAPSKDTKKSAKFKAAMKNRTKPDTTTELRSTVELTGYAGTDVEVARFIRNLSGSPLTSAVDLEYTKEATFEDVNVREFKVIADLRPDVDAIVAVRNLGHQSKSIIPSVLKSLMGADS